MDDMPGEYRIKWSDDQSNESKKSSSLDLVPFRKLDWSLIGTKEDERFLDDLSSPFCTSIMNAVTLDASSIPPNSFMAVLVDRPESRKVEEFWREL